MVRVKIGRTIYNVSAALTVAAALVVAKLHAHTEANNGALIWHHTLGYSKTFYCIHCNHVEVSPMGTCICSPCSMVLNHRK